MKESIIIFFNLFSGHFSLSQEMNSLLNELENAIDSDKPVIFDELSSYLRNDYIDYVFLHKRKINV